MENDKKQQSVKSSGRVLTIVSALILSAVNAVCLGVSGYLHYDRQLENEAELVQVSAGQAATGIEMQLAKLEDVSVILLADKEHLSFDAADDTKDEYERSLELAELKKAVTEMSLMDNYCDLTLIYRSDDNAGILSADTRELLCDEKGSVYPVLTDLLGGEHSRWVTGIRGNFDKVFYICRANDHTLFLGGFYTDELRYMLNPGERPENARMMLLDGRGRTILSVGDAEEDSSFDGETGDNYALIGNDMVQAGKTLKNGWQVVIIKDMTDTAEYYKKLGLEISVALALTLSALVVVYIVNSGNEAVYGGTKMMTPEVDMLTGVTNAEEAENIMADRLETCVSGSTFMLALVKIVNLKELEKKYGRSGFNGAIIKTYRGLAEFFGTDDPSSPNILGRTNDGEFLVLSDHTQYDLFKANDELKESLTQLSRSLNSLAIANEGEVDVRIGAAVYPHNSSDYDTLFDMAEAALNMAIEDDEKSYALYKKEKE